VSALPSAVPARGFVPEWRRRKCAAFDLARNASVPRTVALDLWGRQVEIYANANLSIYSGQTCNAHCRFCVEELRPASRGGNLAGQKTVEQDDDRYFAALDRVLGALRPLNPSVSVTGGEASRDPRLPRILRAIARAGCRKRTITTNGSGLLDRREGAAVLDWLARTGVAHLNLSRAHPDDDANARLMGLREPMPRRFLGQVSARARAGGIRPRLSCVLLRDGIARFEQLVDYLEFARGLGVDNVIFRQLMTTDPRSHAPNLVVRYCDRQRVALGPLLERVSGDRRFAFVRQVVGYYYYVEVWRSRGIDVVFEEADLARLETTKRRRPELIHELVFHPNARLASTWQPWDGVLGPIP
jgi:molybdenum cofactor biosynthesis enzyme MoaA